MPANDIIIEGARQNNLKGLDLRLPLNELIVVTGVSGSGKSSLAFDTIYSEGQRRYVETFSPYARQFLDRMDKPHTDRIEGIPPAIAIDQTNPVRTSRSTVGTMTELNDHLKLLFARCARLHCQGCGEPVRRDTPESIFDALGDHFATADGRAGKFGVVVTFLVPVPENASVDEVKDLLAQQGYVKFHREDDTVIEVVQDRTPFAGARRERIVDDLEAALKHGRGLVQVYPLRDKRLAREPLRFSSDLHCPGCDIHYQEPTPNLFSFNSPLGACETCRGFGRTIGIDYGLVVPDERLSLADGAIRPWQTGKSRECQEDLLRFAKHRGVPTGAPWQALEEADRRWILDGDGDWEDGKWYGVKRYFEWLESKSYRMHIRVLLAKYRTYSSCPACDGARLKPESLLWRLGDAAYSVQDVLQLPLASCHAFFAGVALPPPMDEATKLLLGEIRRRLGYLVEVGLGYLTLDRQSRTLSGGEVQRINLTTALGTSLVNTLFVLDEPSIGLHPRDIRRLIGVLQRLRDAGNTLIVVEHDPDVIRAADRVLDIGPGPGEHGGEIVSFGTLPQLLRRKRSLTAQYLTGAKTVTGDAEASTPVTEQAPRLSVIGAAEHNLKDIDVHFPLNRLVCITGVSGSGKSTLLQDVLYNGLRALQHRPVDAPGRHRQIVGHEPIGDVVLVDQSPIGKTTRSNPATYVGAFAAIRKMFAAEPLARERGYTAGAFSFNAAAGRCPTCSGSGFEHVEMQFLSDVYLRCPDCDGGRYRPEVLEVVRLPPDAASSGPGGAKSVADVLEMTVSEACEFFCDSREVLRSLEPLRAVGLGYVKLGQPVPTLSGGEAQRLKLAGHLATASGRSSSVKAGTLFLFDEPTTGLHFDDIATLLTALRELLERGHSVVVIEHNVDVIRSADWVIDLGPEGGEAGGEIVCVGDPATVRKCRDSHTGAALRRALGKNKGRAKAGAGAATARRKPGAARRDDVIGIRHAREHNLKNIDLQIPRNAFTVITGVSGSGKSTVAFDILFAEGQRRYLESLNAYARQFVQPATRPDVDVIYGIPPTVAIEQRTSRGGRKSTVATVTEIYHFLRLLFVKLGVQYCPDCEVPIQPQTREAIVARLLRDYRGRRVQALAPLVVSRKGYYTDLATWAAGKGFAHLRVDGELTPTADWPRLDRFKEHDIELPVGEVTVDPRAEEALWQLVEQALDFGKGVVYVLARGRGKGSRRPTIFSTKRACPECSRSFKDLDPRMFSYNSPHGWCPACFGVGQKLSGFDAEQTGEEAAWRAPEDGEERACPVCDGRRLRPETLAVRFRSQSIAEFTSLTVDEAKAKVGRLRLSGRDAEVARDIVTELTSRLEFLSRVGLPYLSLDRAAPTLSGGEAQRIRLAAQLGSNLRGVCYILDEPTIGLHARDNGMLLDTLGQLEAKGNSVVVVEHDEDTIRRAEHVIDLGPGGGVDGGKVVAAGTVAELMRNPRSLTAKFLREPLAHPLTGRGPRRLGEAEDAQTLEIVGARLHNLRDLHVTLPLGALICVTGVSGSGKSTLARTILRENLRRATAARRGKGRVQWHGCAELIGAEAVGRVLEVDQTPIGKTPRSCPATYVGFWSDVRRLFAATSEARLRGYGIGRFSFNVAAGRCPECAGQGMKTIEMSFLPNVAVPCEVCHGQRFTPETLAVHFRDRTVGEVLAMSVDEAVDFFAAHRSIHHALRLLQDVGLGYLTLGQQSPTLSGGEAQRIKLVTELAKARTSTADAGASRAAARHTVYVLDEPTIGLHMADVEKLIRVLHRLVDAGNTVVIVEHNLDVVAEADWLIDLGPEGGDGGGRIVAQGVPLEVAKVRRGSHTARFLSRFLKSRSQPAGGSGARPAGRPHP